jgi:predicted RNase H-like HicB family nuclease
MRRYTVVFETTATGYSAYVPDLPGCAATGETKVQAEENIYDAIQFHIEGLEAEGLPIPEGKAEAEIMVIPR